MKIDKSTVVVITGASRGIGKETALAFARKGATIVLASRDKNRMEETSKKVEEAGGRACIKPTDVSKEDQCRALIEDAYQQYGHIDVLINNAGYGHYASVENIKTADLDAILRTNLFGSLWCIQAALPLMREKKKGHIVNVSTIVSRRSLPFMTAYCMSKFAMNAMDEGLRLEARPFGIGVTLLCPGLTQTDFQTNAGKVGYSSPVSNSHGMSAKTVAQKILKAVEKNQRRVYLTGTGKALLWLQKFCPSIVDELIYMMYSRQLNAHGQS
ncbi:MAG: SDR family oxidoreductase [Bdellovibrionales bacterium]|nr:SDR family oxidoreductase [Bdellovibrionales bacterium]